MPIYSYSKIKLFKECPKKYEFKYIDKPEVPSVETIKAFLGTIVHDSLKNLYEQVRTGKVPTKEEVVTYFDKKWDQEWTEEIFIFDNRSPSDYRSIGRLCLQSFYDINHPFDQSKTIGQDYEAKISLVDSEEYQIRGFIDRLAKAPDGTYEIHDYKTLKDPPPQVVLENDYQLQLYDLLIRKNWLDKIEKITCIWHYLQSGESLAVSRNEQQVEEFKTNVIVEIDKIEYATEAENFPPHKGDHCNWCEYKQLCPAWKHWFQLTTEKGTIGEAHQAVLMVDRYVELKEEEDALEKEIKDVKKVILEYARESNSTSLCGNKKEVRVSFRENLKVPSKSDDPVARELFEKLLVENNLWDKVVDITTSRVSQLLKDKTVPEGPKGKLKELISIEKTPYLNIAKRKDVPGEESG